MEENNVVVPGKKEALVCLITGIVAVACSGTSVLGIVAGIIAMIFGNKAVEAGNTSTQAKVGKILGLVGIILSALCLLLYCGGCTLGFCAGFLSEM